MATPLDHKRTASDKQADSALQKSPKELLSDIHYQIDNYDDRSSPAKVHFAFASLLSVLAEQASRDTSKIVRLTWGLFWLTVALLVIAVVMMFR